MSTKYGVTCSECGSWNAHTLDAEKEALKLRKVNAGLIEEVEFLRESKKYLMEDRDRGWEHAAKNAKERDTVIAAWKDYLELEENWT